MGAVETITVYSTHCPKCKELEEKLHHKRLLFEVVDNMEMVMEQAKRFNISMVPFVVVNRGCADEQMLDFNQAVKHFEL